MICKKWKNEKEVSSFFVAMFYQDVCHVLIQVVKSHTGTTLLS